MKYYRINEQPFIDLIRYAPMSDRLNFAFEYIDSVILEFIKYGYKSNGQALIEICKAGQRGWKKICRYEIVVHTDKEGFEYLLEPQTYADYMMRRFLGTSETKEQYVQMCVTLSKIFAHLKFHWNTPEPWEEFILTDDYSPASSSPPLGEGEASEGE